MKFLSKTVLAVTALVVASSPLSAAEVKRFDAVTFAAAQKAGRPILVDVKAWWCPVCASQNATIRDTVSAATYKNVLILEVNYDKQQDVWQGLGVNKQGTLIAYRGGKELQRLQFVTDKVQINTLLGRLAS